MSYAKMILKIVFIKKLKRFTATLASLCLMLEPSKLAETTHCAHKQTKKTEA